jgi:hypothetical protein
MENEMIHQKNWIPPKNSWTPIQAAKIKMCKKSSEQYQFLDHSLLQKSALTKKFE